MTQRPALDSIESVVAESPSVTASGKKAVAASLELHGDEIIQLSIRPSPWCIAVYAFKLVVGALLLGGAIVAAARGRAPLGVSVALLVLLLTMFSGIVAATLQWASQLYVLTNRRVICFRGVFSVDARECALTRISGLDLQRTWYHGPLHLGTLELRPVKAGQAAIRWEHVPRPEEVYDILAQAIRKAQMR